MNELWPIPIGAYITGRMGFAQVDVFYEGDVIFRMPIQRVEDAIERYRIEHLVNRLQHVIAVLHEMKPAPKTRIINQN